ncbi:single-stranded DNA-binding protein [Thermodesulfovibrionales bacterium]|nr:single-stranded DNA-binding protein [Thermodesulfovibrionales bacterium]MCL0068314.1 single-stranded DNA-binding protein [Thermodesulfovibrionales bacterium]
MLNKIISIGNLTKDPDVRYTATGMPVTPGPGTASRIFLIRHRQGRSRT